MPTKLAIKFHAALGMKFYRGFCEAKKLPRKSFKFHAALGMKFYRGFCEAKKLPRKSSIF